MPWTRITDPEDAEHLLPAWIGKRLIGLHGRFGLLLTTGDVLRITSITSAHLSSDGVVLLDVSLDNAGVPDGVDQAWRSKHFLGAPVPGATAATVNLSQVVTAVEFLAVVGVDMSGDRDSPTATEVVDELERAAEAAAHGGVVTETAISGASVRGLGDVGASGAAVEAAGPRTVKTGAGSWRPNHGR